MAALRDYQSTALQSIRDATREGVRRMILQMPTGAGKTRIAAEIVNGARSKYKRVIFVVPNISLIDQTVEMFYAEGIKTIGVIQRSGINGHRLTDWSQPVQIASVQTMIRQGLFPADVVIRDEAHKLFDFDVQWMNDPGWADIPFIGLTATPWTRGLGQYFKKLVIGATIKQLIAEGYLSKFRAFAPSHPNLEGVEVLAGDYNGAQLSVAMRRNGLTGDIVETWKKHGRGRPTLCFAVDRVHAKALQEMFNEAGVRTAYMDAKTSLFERNAIKKDFESGAAEVVCNVDVMGIGVDWPSVACISYCRPTKSIIRYVQNIGRGLRKTKGKEDLLILDHSDTTLRLGFVTDIGLDKLSEGKFPVRANWQPKPRECKKCHAIRPPGMPCPNCGHQAEPREKVVNMQTAEGELREYDELPKYVGPSQEFTWADRAVFFGELKGYAIERGFSPGWAVHAYEKKFGALPWIDHVYESPAIRASEKMRSWIKGAVLIRRAKRGNGNGSDYAAAKARSSAQRKSEDRIEEITEGSGLAEGPPSA